MKIKELIEQIRDGKIQSDINLQREIIYKPEKQRLVIDSIVMGIKLPAFYFWSNGDSDFEVLDGKQRIHAIREFLENRLLFKNKAWHEYDHDWQEKINNTEITIIFHKGDEEFRSQIFYRINKCGIPLSDFEVLNGLYNGVYLNELKEISKRICQQPNYKGILKTNNRGKNELYILRTIFDVKDFQKIKIIIEKQKLNTYITSKEHKLFVKWLDFICDIFTKDKFKDRDILFKLAKKYLVQKNQWLNQKDKINLEINNFKKSDQWKLSLNHELDYEEIILAIVNNIIFDPIRRFSHKVKQELIKKNGFNCSFSNSKHECEENRLEVDHIKPWSKGGQTIISNAQLLCRNHNRAKKNK